MIERTVDLWQYLPEFLKQFRELDGLFEAERPQFQALEHNRQSLLDNLFIETATNEGLKRFESILGLTPSAGETLEVRRSNVLTNWFSNKVYTMKTLLTILQVLQGNNNVQLTWDSVDPFLLHVVTRLEKRGQVDKVYEILEKMLPMNVDYDSDNFIEVNQTIPLYTAVGLTGTFTLFLTNDFNEEVDISGNAFVGMANTYTEIISTN